MNVTVDKQSPRKLEAGDIIHFKGSSVKREHNFYMICHTENMNEYFLISLTGRKGARTTYKSVDELIESQKGKYDIYTKEEYELKLASK